MPEPICLFVFVPSVLCTQLHFHALCEHNAYFIIMSLLAMVFCPQQLQQWRWSMVLSNVLESSDVAYTAATASTSHTATNVLSTTEHRR